MYSWFRFSLFIATIALLYGCSGTGDVPSPTVVEKIKTVVIAPPEKLLDSFHIPAPHYSPEAYSQLSCKDKEETNFTTIGELYHALSLANIQIRSIKQWVSEQKDIYKEE